MYKYPKYTLNTEPLIIEECKSMFHPINDNSPISAYPIYYPIFRIISLCDIPFYFVAKASYSIMLGLRVIVSSIALYSPIKGALGLSCKDGAGHKKFFRIDFRGWFLANFLRFLIIKKGVQGC